MYIVQQNVKDIIETANKDRNIILDTQILGIFNNYEKAIECRNKNYNEYMKSYANYTCDFFIYKIETDLYDK